MRAIAMRRKTPSVEEGLAIDVAHRRDPLEILVVAIPLASERGVQRMMEVVGPLRVETMPPRLGRPH